MQLGVVIAGVAAMLAGFVVRAGEAFGLEPRPASPAALVLFLGGLALTLLAFVVHVHAAWSALGEDARRTSPLRAAVLLLIPVFNFYWLFVAVHGFALDFNAAAAGSGRNAPRLPQGLHLAFCLSSCASALPYVGVFSAALTLPLLLLVMTANLRALGGLNPAH